MRKLILGIFIFFVVSNVFSQDSWAYHKVNKEGYSFEMIDVFTKDFPNDASISIIRFAQGKYKLMVVGAGSFFGDRYIQRVVFGTKSGEESNLFEFEMNKMPNEDALSIDIFPFSSERDFISSLKTGSIVSILVNDKGFNFTLKGSKVALGKIGL